jgi:hypothetical protein
MGHRSQCVPVQIIASQPFRAIRNDPYLYARFFRTLDVAAAVFIQALS